MKAAENAAAVGDGNSKIGDVAHGAGTKADDASVKGIAEGIKGIVDAAGKASGEDGGGGALKGVKEATGNSNADAGKLFDTNGGGQAGAADVGKASDAVSAVSGKQIIKAIVDAAGKGDHAGAAAGDATNPIAAAIGQAGQDGAAFNNNNNMKKDDKIAAAIVLRGLAKGGKFAADSADAGAKDGKKGDAVTSVVQEVNKWLEEMMKAAEKAAAAGDGNSKIGDVAHGAGTKADDASVKGIAEEIKGIVDAAGKASGEDGDALKGVKEAAGNSNEDAGKLFDTQGGNRANAEAVGKASDAVSAVSGKQIIKAIVDAAGRF